MNSTPVTRRRVLSASLTSLVAAGAASILPAGQEPATVHAEPRTPSIVVVNYADLAAECSRREAEARRTLIAVGEVSGPFNATLTDEQRGLSEAYDNALFEHHQATMEWYVAELQRHFPGLAGAIMATWHHVQDEASASYVPCCAEPEG